MQSTQVAPELKLSVRVIEGAAGLAALDSAWDDLFGRALNAPAFLSRPWLSTFVASSRYRGSILILTVWRAETLVAMLPLCVRRRCGIRLAEVLGTGMPAFLGLLLDPGCPEAVPLIADTLRRQRLLDCLCMHDVLSSDESTASLLKELAARGFACRAVLRNVSHWIRLEPSYEQYLAATKSAKRRHELKREERKLFSDAQGVLEHYSGPQITPQLIGRMAEIQNEGWQKARGANLLALPWHVELVLQMARAGLAQAWIIRVKDEDAAFGLVFMAHRWLHYYYTGFKSRFLPLSAGKAITACLIRSACEGGFQVFDFGHSDQEYKKFWSTHVMQIHRVAIGRGLAGALVSYAHHLAWRIHAIPRVRLLYAKLKIWMARRKIAEANSEVVESSGAAPSHMPAARLAEQEHVGAGCDTKLG